MTDGIDGVIERLERQKTAIERALAALREIGGTQAPGVGAPDRRSAAQKKRWAVKRASAQGTPAAAPARGRLTPEGRKRLADAMRKRWALAKAAGTTPIAAKKAVAKKAAAKAKKKSAAKAA